MADQLRYPGSGDDVGVPPSREPATARQRRKRVLVVIVVITLLALVVFLHVTTVAVDGLSFTVPPGQVTGFLGPNGAGKSTTMRMILGLDAADSGSVIVAGRPYAGPSPASRGILALVPEFWRPLPRKQRSPDIARLKELRGDLCGSRTPRENPGHKAGHLKSLVLSPRRHPGLGVPIRVPHLGPRQCPFC